MRRRPARAGARGRRATVLVPLLLIVTAAFGGEAAAPLAAQARDAKASDGKPSMEELIVRARALHQLHQAVVDAEVRFYALYDSLNTRHEYDVRCAEEAPVGRRLASRVCRPAYLDDASAAEAQAFLDGHSSTWATTVEMARKDGLRRNLLEVVRRNPQLFLLMKERVELANRYEQARREQIKAGGNPDG